MRSLIVILHVIENLLERAPIQKIFELRSAPLRIDRTVRRLPVLAIITSPLALKAFLVAVFDPKLRFLEMYRLDASIERPLDAGAEIFPIISSGAHVIDVAAMPMGIAIAIGLAFVGMIDAVVLARDVILVLAPRDASHQMNLIAVLAPRRRSITEGRADAIYDRHVGSQVGQTTPRLAGLEARAFEFLLRVSGERTFLDCKWRTVDDATGNAESAHDNHGP